jgi:hypothetical protein
MQDLTDVHKILVGELVGKRPLSRCKGDWQDTIKMVLKKAAYVDCSFRMGLVTDFCYYGNEKSVFVREVELLTNPASISF